MISSVHETRKRPKKKMIIGNAKICPIKNPKNI